MIDLTSQDVDASFGRRAFRFRHDVDLSSLTESSLVEVASQLPHGWVIGGSTGLGYGDPRDSRPLVADEDAATLVGSMTTSPLAIRLYHLELAPGFRPATEALTGVVSSMGPAVDDEGGVDEVNLALFLAPPGAVTPAHPDRHHNLLLQVEGTKRVWVEDLGHDPVAHHRATVEYFRDPGAGVRDLPPALELELRPGDAVYVPPTAFHWTEVVGGDRSVALSVGFSTPTTLRAVRASYFDSTLHRLGWRSRPGGRWKHVAIRTLDAVRRTPVSRT